MTTYGYISISTQQNCYHPVKITQGIDIFIYEVYLNLRNEVLYLAAKKKC